MSLNFGLIFTEKEGNPSRDRHVTDSRAGSWLYLKPQSFLQGLHRAWSFPIKSSLYCLIHKCSDTFSVTFSVT